MAAFATALPSLNRSPLHQQLSAFQVPPSQSLIISEGLRLACDLSAAAAIARLWKSLYQPGLLTATPTTAGPYTQMQAHLKHCKTLSQTFQEFQRRLNTFATPLSDIIKEAEEVKVGQTYMSESLNYSLYELCQTNLPTLRAYQRLVESLQASLTLEKEDPFGFSKSYAELSELGPKDPLKIPVDTSKTQFVEKQLFQVLKADFEKHWQHSVALLRHLASATLIMEVYQRVITRANIDDGKVDTITELHTKPLAQEALETIKKAEREAAQKALQEANTFNFAQKILTTTGGSIHPYIIYQTGSFTPTQESYKIYQSDVLDLKNRVESAIASFSAFQAVAKERYSFAQSVLPHLKDYTLQLESLRHRLELVMSGSDLNMYGFEKAIMRVHERNFQAAEKTLNNALHPFSYFDATIEATRQMFHALSAGWFSSSTTQSSASAGASAQESSADAEVFQSTASNT